MYGETLVELKDLRILRADQIALKNQSIKNTDTQLREFMVSIRMKNQQIEFNMENTEEEYKKGINKNTALFLLNDNVVQIQIQENHYRLERDEEAFIKQLRDNMSNQATMQQFLNQKAGGIEGTGSVRGLGDLIKKKKVKTNTMNPKRLYDSNIDFTNVLNEAEKTFPTFIFKSFELQLTDKITLAGSIRLIQNEFTKMPRGQISIKIDCATTFKKDQYTPYKDLVFLFTKDVGQGGETMQYKITEAELNDEDASNDVIRFETFHYDDYIKLEVFHKGSIQKGSKIGKAFINLRELNC